MNDRIDLSLIIVSWNVKKLLKQCLESITKAQGNLNLEVFIVDNASTDGTVEEIKKLSQPEADHPLDENKKIKGNANKQLNPSDEWQVTSDMNIKFILNKENLGFAKANNQAIKKAHAEFILLLNPDMKLFPDTLTNMVNWLRENPKVKVAGCHLVDDQSQTIYHVRRFPTVWNQLAIILKLPHIFPFILNKYLRKNFDYTKEQKVDSIRGGFFMIRRKPEGEVPMSHLQKLDERYFLWFEEVDFCRQIKENGGEVWYTPVAKAIDYVGQSFKQLPRGKAQKYFKESMLKYFKKWQPLWQYLLLKLAWPLGLAVTWLGEKLNVKNKIKT